MKRKIRLVFLVLVIVVITASAISFSGFTYIDTNAVVDYYDCVERQGDIETYFTTINGIKTENYYSVRYENGEVVQTYPSMISLAKIILPIRVFETSEPPQNRIISGNNYNLVELVYSQIMYINLNNRMVPVETNIYNYKFDGLSEYKGLYILNSDNELVMYNDGYSELTICYNLYDGSEIDYATLNSYERIIGY